MKILLPAFSLAGLLITASASTEMIKDIDYAPARDGVALKLDVNVPDGVGPFPIAILVHGGGNKGDKQSFVTPLFAPLTAASFTWFTIDFRPVKARFAAQIDDIETAICWIKAHANQYKGDPHRVALIGESTGGILVCDVAGRAKVGSTVDAVVAFYTPADMSYPMRNGKMTQKARDFWGLKESDDLTTWVHDFSPITYAKAGMPPVLLIHGTKDSRVPYENSVRLEKALKEAGVPCELISIEGGDHGMSSWETIDPSYKAKMITWLERTLKPAGGG